MYILAATLEDSLNSCSQLTAPTVAGLCRGVGKFPEGKFLEGNSITEREDCCGPDTLTSSWPEEVLLSLVVFGLNECCNTV